MPRIAPVLGYFVLKLAPVQSIFRTKFCPGLGLFFIFCEVKNVPFSPGPRPENRHPPHFYLPMTPSVLANLINSTLCKSIKN